MAHTTSPPTKSCADHPPHTLVHGLTSIPTVIFCCSQMPSPLPKMRIYAVSQRIWEGYPQCMMHCHAFSCSKIELSQIWEGYPQCMMHCHAFSCSKILLHSQDVKYGRGTPNAWCISMHSQEVKYWRGTPNAWCIAMHSQEVVHLSQIWYLPPMHDALPCILRKF